MEIAIEFAKWMNEPMFKILPMHKWITRCVLQQPDCNTYKILTSDGDFDTYDGHDEFSLEELFLIFKETKGY